MIVFFSLDPFPLRAEITYLINHAYPLSPLPNYPEDS